MGPAAAYAYVAMKDAIADAGLTPDMVSNLRTGLITGSGGGSPENQVEAADTARSKGIKRIGAFMVPRTMTSTTSACLATPFAIKGINFTIASACATSAHCIGESAEKIALGKQDVMFAGGGEELHWSLSCLFDAMGALSSRRNATPAGKASVERAPAAAQPVGPTVIQRGAGATTNLVSKPATPPLHQQAGLPKVAATPGFVDSATLLPKRGAQGAATRAPESDSDKPRKAQ